MTSTTEYAALLVEALGRFQSITNTAFITTCANRSPRGEAPARQYLEDLCTKTHLLTGAVEIPPESRGNITASWKAWVQGGQFFEYVQSNGEKKGADYNRIILEFLNREALMAEIENGTSEAWAWRNSPEDFPQQMREAGTGDIRKVLDKLKEIGAERYPVT